MSSLVQFNTNTQHENANEKVNENNYVRRDDWENVSKLLSGTVYIMRDRDLYRLEPSSTFYIIDVYLPHLN